MLNRPVAAPFHEKPVHSFYVSGTLEKSHPNFAGFYDKL